MRSSDKRPSSVKQKKVFVQTLELNAPAEENKQVKKVALPKTGTTKPPRASSPTDNQHQFQDFMQQKIQNNSKLKQLYEQDGSAQRIASKPFQLSKQRSSQVDDKSVLSAQTEFTLSSQDTNKKPYRKFYKDFKQFDTSVPTKQQMRKQGKLDKIEAQEINEISNPSFASTEKSYEQTNIDVDAISVSSQSSRKVEQQNFKQYMKMQQSGEQFHQQPQQQQEQSQQINFRGWTVSEPAPVPSRLQTRQYQSVMENLEQIVENGSRQRNIYLSELDNYVKMLKGGQKQKVEKPTGLTQDEQSVLEREIKKLAKQLKKKEEEHFQKQASQSVSSLHSIAEDSIENLSQMSAQGLRNRSMFITELLKNRNRFQQSLQNKEITEDNPLDRSGMSDSLEVLQKKVNKQQSKLSESTRTISDEFTIRIEQLLNNEPIDPNPFDMFKENGQKAKWDDIHQKLKGFNKAVKEFDAIEMYDEMLPKDRVLRQEAVERIIRTKKEEVDKNLKELASKYQSDVLEDKFKIQDMVKKLKSTQLGDDHLKRFPNYLEEKQARELKYKEMQDQQMEAEVLIGSFNPKEIMMELGQLKYELDDAIQYGNALRQEIHEDPKFQLAEAIQEKKLELAEILKESAILNERAERLFHLEEMFRNLSDEPVLGEIDCNLPQYVAKSIEDYDREISDKLRIEQPEIFQD